MSLHTLKLVPQDEIGGSGEPPHNGDMEHRITALETRLDTILPTLATKADIQQATSETHKWMLGTVIGLFIGFGGLFFAMSNALKPIPSSTPMQQAPIIINVPAPAATK